MAPSGKTTAGALKDRRKSGAKSSPGFVTLTVSPERLRAIINPSPPSVKEDTPPKEADESPATSTTVPAAPASNAENASDSNPATPAGSGTPAPASDMGPPTEGQGPKKKGVKRSAGAANGANLSEPQIKIRGKPGPKKRQRMDDGTIEPTRGAALGHKLNPKANQGAINANLRALDRSGKPCRKWAKGGFTLKSFTGVIWEVPRWTAPTKSLPESTTEEGSAASAEGSTKENKENDQLKSENSNSGGDVEMQSAPSVHASSPAPLAIAAGA